MGTRTGAPGTIAVEAAAGRGGEPSVNPPRPHLPRPRRPSGSPSSPRGQPQREAGGRAGRLRDLVDHRAQLGHLVATPGTRAPWLSSISATSLRCTARVGAWPRRAQQLSRVDGSSNVAGERRGVAAAGNEMRRRRRSSGRAADDRRADAAPIRAQKLPHIIAVGHGADRWGTMSLDDQPPAGVAGTTPPGRAGRAQARGAAHALPRPAGRAPAPRLARRLDSAEPTPHCRAGPGRTRLSGRPRIGSGWPI